MRLMQARKNNGSPPAAVRDFPKGTVPLKWVHIKRLGITHSRNGFLKLMEEKLL